MPVARRKIDHVSGSVNSKEFLDALRQDIEYKDSNAFLSESIEEDLFGSMFLPQSLPSGSWYRPTLDRTDAGDKTQPNESPMTFEEEKIAFLRYNYAKRKAATLRTHLLRVGIENARAETVAEFMRWRELAHHQREFICRKNLPLVLFQLKKLQFEGSMDLGDIISEGNAALMRVIEGFIVDKGYKFSTYACRAIRSGFSRSLNRQRRTSRRSPISLSDMNPSMGYDRRVRTRPNHEAQTADHLDMLRDFISNKKSDLTDRERRVLWLRFDLDGTHGEGLSLQETGNIVGLTKERIRQIQNKAFKKIRDAFEESLKPRPKRKHR